MKYVIILLSVILMIAGIGCVAVSEWVTPATIDRQAVGYAATAGVADVNDYGGWPNLYKARRLADDVDAGHETIQLDLVQQMQRDDLAYSTHKDVTAENVIASQKREEQLFGEKGLLSTGLAMLGFGSLTGFVGLMRKRPSDITKDEFETALAQTKGTTAAELSAKDRQFVQVVSGMQKFVKSLSPTHIAEFKAAMNQSQDTDTQVAVAAAKKQTNL